MTTVEDIRRVLDRLGFQFEEGTDKTPRRVVDYWQSMISANVPVKWTVFDPGEDPGIICVKDIEFYSACEHHLLPFFGTAHVAYIPDKVMVGISKLPRCVKYHAVNFTTQEYLGEAIVKDIVSRLKPFAVAVILEARHTCMSCRGVESVSAITKTIHLYGSFKTDPMQRQEVLSLLS